MNSQSILTRADYEDYLVYLYFGDLSDYVGNCVSRAYRDFSRTLHGLRLLEANHDLYKRAHGVVVERLEYLRDPSTQPSTVEAFDAWHRETCAQLVALYRGHGHLMYIGQAQKWLNMALKYIYTLGEDRLSGFQAVYLLCHVPLDSVLIKRLQKYGAPRLPPRWSRIDDYDQYLSYQRWIRQHFTHAPLDVEFKVWMRGVPPE